MSAYTELSERLEAVQVQYQSRWTSTDYNNAVAILDLVREQHEALGLAYSAFAHNGGPIWDKVLAAHNHGERAGVGEAQ